MMNFESEFRQLQSEFYRIRSEFDSFQGQINTKLNNKYDCDSVEYKLEQIRQSIMILEARIEEKFSLLPHQQVLNVYYLEHKENYNSVFYDLYELSEFLKEKIFKDENVHFKVFSYNTEYSFHVNLNSRDTYFQYSNFEARDFLIKIPCFDEENPTLEHYKYCINTEVLVRKLKETIFNGIMTN